MSTHEHRAYTHVQTRCLSDVVMPFLDVSSLDVIKTQLTLEILTGTLGLPP